MKRAAAVNHLGTIMMGVAIGLAVSVPIGEAGQYWKLLLIIAAGVFVDGLLLLVAGESRMRRVGEAMMAAAIPVFLVTGLFFVWPVTLYLLSVAATLLLGGMVLFVASLDQLGDFD